MKKSLALALSAVMSLSLLTACGTTDESSSSSPDKAASTASAAKSSESTSAETEETSDDVTEPTKKNVKLPKQSQTETEAVTDEEYSDDHEYREDNSYANPNDDVSDGERAMELMEKARSIPSDSDGFKIEDGILYGYDGVESELHIPDSVTRIESWAFKNDSSIVAVYIPSSVKSIGACVFDCADALRFVDIAEGLETIAGGSFSRCSSLRDINLPASLKSVGEPSFWADGDLTIHAPGGSYAEKLAKGSSDAKYSSEPAVYEAIDLKNVIRARQYEYGDFTEFTIPDNITSIEGSAFEYCEQLREITIPSNVKSIGSQAFSYCSGLKSVTIDGCTEIVGRAFEYCDSLETVRINEGCETIGASAFAYEPVLKEVWLPASIKKMDESAFEYYGDGCIFHVPSGSYAEKFMIKYNLNYDNNV